MKRINITPRIGLKNHLEDRGMLYHEGYYKETSAYHFSVMEIDKLEAATNELFGMCMKAVQHVIDNKLWDQFFIPREQADFITRSWNEDDVSLYGRFDLGYNSHTGEIKMLEFNADTPTSLLEASVIQWDWKESVGKKDQWNGLHERIVAHLGLCREYIGRHIHVACARDSAEDYMTVSYLAECARQAGYETTVIYVDEIGVDNQNRFATANAVPIKSIFKLYPWEWLMNEEFGKYLGVNYGYTTWIEPPYKAILSNKMLLPILWELFPDHPLLLESVYTDLSNGRNLPEGDWCIKPVYSREGQNVSIVKDGETHQTTDGEYGEEGYIAQRFFEIESFDGWLPVIGAWVIAGEAAGMGIREEKDSLITTNMAQFAPHWFDGLSLAK